LSSVATAAITPTTDMHASLSITVKSTNTAVTQSGESVSTSITEVEMTKNQTDARNSNSLTNMTNLQFVIIGVLVLLVVLLVVALVCFMYRKKSARARNYDSASPRISTSTMVH
jgi:beta-lactamase regulating signal transducer with metallopeptidase domain